MNTTPIQAVRRDATGKGVARKIRAKGEIPALVYRAGQPPLHVQVNPADLVRAFRTANNNYNLLLDVKLGDDSHVCLLRETQKHPVSRALLHADFYEVDLNTEVVVDVAVQPVGKAVGTTVGGRLVVLARSVRLRCKPGDIPAMIDVDVTELNVGQFLKASKVTLPAGCTLAVKQDYNVFSVEGKRTEKGDKA